MTKVLLRSVIGPATRDCDMRTLDGDYDDDGDGDELLVSGGDRSQVTSYK